MTREEAIKVIEIIEKRFITLDKEERQALILAIKALEQEPCEDCISKKAVLDIVDSYSESRSNVEDVTQDIISDIMALPTVAPQQKMGHCKDCKYFEYDSVANVNGTPLIVAHEICSKWGRGCKTEEDGYCFLFEPQESKD